MPAHKVTSKLCQMAAGDTFLHLPAFRCDREDDLCDSGYTSDWGSERCVSSSLDPFHPFLAANRASDEWRTSDKVVCMYSPLHLGRVARYRDTYPPLKLRKQHPCGLYHYDIMKMKGKGKVRRFSQFVISPVLAGVLLYIFSVSVLLFQNMITTFSAKVSVVF